MRHQPDIDMRKLAWNRLPGPYWFHYTTLFASERIVEEELYVVGERAKPGLFLCDIQPGTLTDAQLMNAILDGTREPERLQAAVVLHDDPALPLKRVSGMARAWWHPAEVGTEISLSGIVVGRAFKRGDLWHYERSLWDFPDPH